MMSATCSGVSCWSPIRRSEIRPRRSIDREWPFHLPCGVPEIPRPYDSFHFEINQAKPPLTPAYVDSGYSTHAFTWILSCNTLFPSGSLGALFPVAHDLLLRAPSSPRSHGWVGSSKPDPTVSYDQEQSQIIICRQRRHTGNYPCRRIPDLLMSHPSG